MRELYKRESTQSFTPDSGYATLIIQANTQRELTAAEYNLLEECASKIMGMLAATEKANDPQEQLLALAEKQNLLDCFPIYPFAVASIPNGYWGTERYSRPWFRCLTKIGWITIGWRKRVISLDWTESIVKLSGEEIWPEEKDTTRSCKNDSAHYRHCWSYAAAKECLATLIALGERQ